MTGRHGGSRLIPILAVLAVLALASLLVAAWWQPLLELFTDPVRLEALVARLGPLGPPAVIVLQAAQVMLAPIPGQIVGLASGFFFGPWLGTLYSMLGIMLGSYLAVRLVRRWGRPLVVRLLPGPALARADRISQRLGAPALFLVFLTPFLPDDTILFVAALTGVSMSDILLAALFGRLPGVFLAAWLGSNSGSLTPTQWAIAVAVTVAIAVPVYLRRQSLERLAWSLIERLPRRRGQQDTTVD